MREFNDGDIVPGTRYRVVRQLGSGGMGSVYLVDHTELGKRFVLKALFRELATRKDLVARLRQEWRALARLCHPNIVSVTDAGTSDTGVPFYVMEHVPGETLGDLLKREHALGIPRAVHIAASVLDALHAAHEIGIVHRDVKPPNIFVCSGGGVKLLDFGVAKLADPSAEVITARGIAIGTPRYMSPEQAKGQAVDHRADLYAAGLVLFETIAGVGPFDDAKDANQLLLAHLTQPAPRLSQFHRAVTPELDDIVNSLLAKDPAARPASAKHVANALRALLVQRRELPSTHGATPHAGYQATTAVPSVAAPSTHRDGVAAREATTVNAPLSRMLAPTEAGSPSFAAVSARAPTELAAPSLSCSAAGLAEATVSVANQELTRPAAPEAAAPAPAPPEPSGARTSPGLDWAKDGFETQSVEAPALPSSNTLVSPPPSNALAAPSSVPAGPGAGPASLRSRTLRLDEMGIPSPDDVETHTSVPPVAACAPGTSSDIPLAETPPPLMSTPLPSASRSARRGLGALVVVVAAVAVAVVAGLGFVGYHLLRSGRTEAVARPTSTSPGPAPSAPVAVEPIRPAEPAASATGAVAASAEPAASATGAVAASAEALAAEPKPAPDSSSAAEAAASPSTASSAKSAKPATDASASSTAAGSSTKPSPSTAAAWSTKPSPSTAAGSSTKPSPSKPSESKPKPRLPKSGL